MRLSRRECPHPQTSEELCKAKTSRHITETRYFVTARFKNPLRAAISWGQTVGRIQQAMYRCRERVELLFLLTTGDVVPPA